MYVRQVMASAVIVVKPRDSVAHARMLLEKHRVNQLPVSVDGKLVGIVTDRDLRDAFPSVVEISATARRRSALHDPEAVDVESVMTANVLTVEPDDKVEDAARLMRRERIGAVPVLEGGHLVGIISRSDVLDVFVRAASSTGNGEAIEVEPPRPLVSRATRAR